MATFKTACASLFLASFLVACSTIPGGHPDSRFAYQAAISDAAVVSPGKISPLRAVPPGATVSVVSWVSEKKNPCARESLPCEVTIGNNPVWVTLSGEVQSICRTWKLQGDALRRRLEQLLGMPMDPPPQYRMAAFAEFDVPRAALERPCLGVDETNPEQPSCTLDARPTTSMKLREVVGRQMADSYVVDNPKGPGYPFTRLGYTYDWAPTAKAGHYGASEFIITPMSSARVTALTSTDDYCRKP
jgi:hypothetical protein